MYRCVDLTKTYCHRNVVTCDIDNTIEFMLLGVYRCRFIILH